MGKKIVAGVNWDPRVRCATERLLPVNRSFKCELRKRSGQQQQHIFGGGIAMIVCCLPGEWAPPCERGHNLGQRGFLMSTERASWVHVAGCGRSSGNLQIVTAYTVSPQSPSVFQNLCYARCRTITIVTANGTIIHSQVSHPCEDRQPLKPRG